MPDNQILLIQSMKHASTKNKSKGKIESIGITKSGKSPYKTYKNIEFKNIMKAKVASKNLIKDRAKVFDKNAGKTIIKYKTKKQARVYNNQEFRCIWLNVGRHY